MLVYAKGLSMPKALLFVVLAFFLVSCTGSTQLPATPSAEEMDKEEQAVFAMVLEGLYAPATRYVLLVTTTTGPSGELDVQAAAERIAQTMHDVDDSTLESFKQRNAEPFDLPTGMNLGSDYSLLSPAQRATIFSQNRDGWQVFYEMYPSAPGITGLSRVGFNESMDQALVYTGTMSHYLAGAGYYLLLNKVNGTWVIDQQVLSWIS
jgi:hypothetical protein